MIKMGLCTLLYNYEFKALDKKLEFLPSNLLLTDKNHIRMQITKRRRRVTSD